MKITFPRRTIAIVAAVGAFAAIGVGSASASSTMPASNPSDYSGLNKSASAQVFNVTISGYKLQGAAFTKTVTNGLMGGMGATVSVKKAVQDGMVTYQTITVTPTKVGQVTSTITNAFATLSGGNYGSAVIRSTVLNQAGTSYSVKLWFDQQGTDPSVNLKFYLYHS